MRKILLLFTFFIVYTNATFNFKQEVKMTYPTAVGGNDGDKFGTKVKVNQDFMGVMTQRTNSFYSYYTSDDNPTLHLYERQLDGNWALFGPPFYIYPFHEAGQSWKMIDFAIVKKNLFITSCKIEVCSLRHFYNDGTTWQLVLKQYWSQGYEDYIYPGFDDMEELSLFGYDDYFAVGCGTTNIPIRLNCNSLKLWKRDPTTLQFTLHQTITAPGEFDDLRSIQDMSPDGQWMIVNPNNDVFQNVGGSWSYHSRIPTLQGLTIDNGRMIGADQLTDTLVTYALENNVWVKKSSFSVGAGMDVTNGMYPEFKLSVERLYLMDKSTSTIKIYEAGATTWSLVQDIVTLGSYQASDFVNDETTQLFRFSATEFAISAPKFDSSKGIVLFIGDGTAYPTVTPTGAPTGVPTGVPSVITFPPALLPVETCDESGVTPLVVAVVTSLAWLGGGTVGAYFTHRFRIRRVDYVATPGARMSHF